MLPKKACDVNRCEVARIMKLTSKGDIEPLPFIVPRKFEGYHPDVYPPTYAGIPALTADEWREGKNSNPYLMSMDPNNSEIIKNDGDGMPMTTVAQPAASAGIASSTSLPPQEALSRTVSNSSVLQAASSSTSTSASASASASASTPVPVPEGAAMVPGRVVNGMVIPAPGYIPKAGDLTIEEIEAELAMLVERMDFLNNALEKLKKD